jgi:hypothetical protein
LLRLLTDVISDGLVELLNLLFLRLLCGLLQVVDAAFEGFSCVLELLCLLLALFRHLFVNFIKG